MIFPNLELESVVQVKDRTRLNGTKTFVSKDEEAITVVEIEPETGNGYIDVTGTTSKDWYLDWEYATDGSKTVSVRVTTDGAPTVKTYEIEVIDVDDDKLFSNDQDLKTHETDILKWIQPGRNTYLDVHRRAQTLIFSYLDEKGITDQDGNKLTKAAVIDISEVKEWSTFLTLKLIFEGISNSTDDVFRFKAIEYAKKEYEARNRAVFRFDLNGDELLTSSDVTNISSVRAIRR